jgi:hypothetical protein
MEATAVGSVEDAGYDDGCVLQTCCSQERGPQQVDVDARKNHPMSSIKTPY